MTAAVGSTIETLTELAAIGLPEPKTDWKPGAETRRLHSGRNKWIGAPTGMWTWGFLTQEQRDALRTLLPDASNSVFVHHRVREDTDEWRYFYAEVYWPEEPREPASIGVRLNFALEIGYMVEVEGPA